MFCDALNNQPSTGLNKTNTTTNMSLQTNRKAMQKVLYFSFNRGFSGTHSCCFLKRMSDKPDPPKGKALEPHIDSRNLLRPPSVKLKKRDKYVLFWFSQKGKYKSMSDIPERITLGEFKRAYDMQRIIGCSVTMVFMCIFVYIGIKYEKYRIANSEYHGERLEKFSEQHGHDVGQRRPARIYRD